MPLAVHGRLFSRGVSFLKQFLQFPTSQLDLDFNFTPLDPAYSLLTTGTLNADHNGMLSPSRVVHISIDPSISAGNPAATADGDEAGGAGFTGTRQLSDIVDGAGRAYIPIMVVRAGDPEQEVLGLALLE